MMDAAVAELQRPIVDYTASLYHEGYLDEQFEQLQQLQDETNPDFVVEVVSLFFDDSERLLDDLSKALDQINVDFKKVDAYVHQLKGSSSSIGACRVQKDCVSFRDYCQSRNIEGCWQWLQAVKCDYFKVKTKLQTLLNQEKQLLKYSGPV